MDSTHPSPPSLTYPYPAAGARGVRDGAPTAPAHALRQRTHPGGFGWADPCVLRLLTVRSDNQGHTTAHVMEERFRHIWDTRKLLFMHPHDMLARGLCEGDLAHVSSVASDEYRRELAGMRIVPYDPPRGSVGGYFPECNALLPVQHHAHLCHLSALGNIPVRVKSATT